MKDSFRLLAPPTDLAISLAQAKKSLEIPDDFDGDDSLVLELIAFATDYIEKTYDFALRAQRVEYMLQAFPAGPIEIPIWPVQSIQYFRYQLASGGAPVELVLGTNYKARLHVKWPQLVLPYNQFWPNGILDTADPITVGLTVGWVRDDSPETLPLPSLVFQACRLLLGGAYEQRQPATDDETERKVRHLLANLR